MRRDVMFLEFDVAIRHSLRDTLLATGNVPAYQVRDYARVALQILPRYELLNSLLENRAFLRESNCCGVPTKVAFWQFVSLWA